MVKELPAQNHWVRALVVSDEFLYSGSYQAVKVSLLASIEQHVHLSCTRYGILTLSSVYEYWIVLVAVCTHY